MNGIEFVETLREKLIQQGVGKEEIIRQIGKATVGWPYVFGAWGEQCTPANRRRRKRDDHPTIVSACQALKGSRESCAGCKWDLPVRMYDCRGFVAWLLGQVGIKITGQGATSQWNTSANWVIKGPISEMPRDRICCVFTGTDRTKEHVGIYLGDWSTVECSRGVQYFSPMKSKWKYYAIPAGLYDALPAGQGQTEQTETPAEKQADAGKPTLRQGSKGEFVQLLQVQLMQRGYQLPKYGADGSFGKETAAAVRAFQEDRGLTADGVVGAQTWAALEEAPPDGSLYTVQIPHMQRAKAETIVAQYPGAWMTAEEKDGET